MMSLGKLISSPIGIGQVDGKDFNAKMFWKEKLCYLQLVDGFLTCCFSGFPEKCILLVGFTLH